MAHRVSLALWKVSCALHPPPLIRSIKRPALNQSLFSSPSRLASISLGYQPISMHHKWSALEIMTYCKIFDALLKGDLPAVRKAVSEAPDINLNRPFEDEWSPAGAGAEPLLSQVIRSRLSVKPDDLEIIKILLRHGCDINASCADAGGTILCQAVTLDSVPLIEFLIENGASVNVDKQRYPDSLSPLGHAVLYDRILNAQLLISHGARVDTDSIEYAGSLEMLELLLLHAPAAVIAESRPVNAAARSGRAKLLALLLEKKFDINAFDDSGQTPLIVACGSSSPVGKTVLMLLENGADISAKSRGSYGGHIVEGDTALHVAPWRSDVDVVRALLNANAEINARNCEGQTPLIKFGLQLTQVCSTPVHSTEIHPRQRVIQMLIDNGADINACDKQGRTVLHAVATQRKYGPRPLILDLMKLLVDAGAQAGASDADGATAVDILRDHQAQELIKPFVQYINQHRNVR